MLIDLLAVKKENKKYDNIKESIPELENYHTLKYSYEEMRELMRFQKKSSQTGGMSYKFTLEKGFSNNDTDNEMTISDIKEIKNGEYEGTIKKKGIEKKTIYFYFVWKGKELFLKRIFGKKGEGMFTKENSEDITTRGFQIAKIEEGVVQTSDGSQDEETPDEGDVLTEENEPIEIDNSSHSLDSDDQFNNIGGAD